MYPRLALSGLLAILAVLSTVAPASAAGTCVINGVTYTATIENDTDGTIDGTSGNDVIRGTNNADLIRGSAAMM